MPTSQLHKYTLGLNSLSCLHFNLPQFGLSSHPFILRPRFLQFLEIWLEKSGSRNLVGEIWFEKSGSRKVVLQNQFFFLVQEKWLTRKEVGLSSKQLRDH